jgi:O-methyltransferase involved in polyketide biosynthesis
MYLTKDAVAAMLRQCAKLTAGSTLAMTFLLPIEYADRELQPILELAAKGARDSGSPFFSYFTPAEMLELARECGFAKVEHVSASALTEHYFAGRADGLRPPLNCEEFLVGRT